MGAFFEGEGNSRIYGGIHIAVCCAVAITFFC